MKSLLISSLLAVTLLFAGMAQAFDECPQPFEDLPSDVVKRLNDKGLYTLPGINNGVYLIDANFKIIGSVRHSNQTMEYFTVSEDPKAVQRFHQLLEEAYPLAVVTKGDY